MNKKNEKETLHFSDIDEPLKLHYVKYILMLIMAFFCALILSIAAGKLRLFLLALIVIASYGCLVSYQIYQVLSGKVMFYTGICVNVHYKKKRNVFDVDYIIVKNNIDGMLLRIVPHSRKEMQQFSSGDTIRIYSTADGDKLPKINNNTYAIPSYYFICCIQTYVARPDDSIQSKNETIDN